MAVLLEWAHLGAKFGPPWLPREWIRRTSRDPTAQPARLSHPKLVVDLASPQRAVHSSGQHLTMPRPFLTALTRSAVRRRGGTVPLPSGCGGAEPDPAQRSFHLLAHWPCGSQGTVVIDVPYSQTGVLGKAGAACRSPGLQLGKCNVLWILCQWRAFVPQSGNCPCNYLVALGSCYRYCPGPAPQGW